MCIYRKSRVVAFIILATTSGIASAGCFPVPAFWGFAIACTLDTEGKALNLMCGAKDVEKESEGLLHRYNMTGKCVERHEIKDSFGGDFGDPVEYEYHFKAKAVTNTARPTLAESTQESVTIYNDAAHTDKIGKIQGTYTCDRDPFERLDAKCDEVNFATTLSKDHGLLTRRPMLFGLASDENVGTSKSPLKTAKPKVYAGVFSAGKDGYYLWRAKGWGNFVKKWQELSVAGFRLEDIESFVSGNDVYFTGVWRQGKGAHYLWRAKGWENFVNKWKELSGKKTRLTNIESYKVGNQRYFVGVWRSGGGGYYLWNVNSWKKFTDKWTELGSKRLRLVDIETYRDGNKNNFVGVWRAGGDGYYLWSTTSWKDLVTKWEELGPKKLRLVDLDILKQGNKFLYTGVWRAGGQGYALWRTGSWSDFVSKWEELSAKNLRLTSLDIQ